MTDFKNTLNLPKTSFPMKGNLPSKEPLIQKKWKEKNLYEKILHSNKDAKKFILHDGPPYANGDIHIGHAVNKILKDIIIRSKILSGFYTPFIPGWDCHGLPIELEVEKKLNKKEGVSDKEFRDLCRKYALEQVERQKKDFIRLGVIGDWENPYLTLNKEFEASTIKALEKIYNNGHLKKGFKPVNWCVKIQSALAEAEVEYKEKESTAIDVKFKITSDQNIEKIFNIKNVVSETFIVIWTTTPWTLPSNKSVAIKKDFDYILISDQKENFIIAENLLEKFRERVKSDLEIIAKCRGENLLTLECEHPFLDNKIHIIDSDHVTDDSGTGCVHIAPAHGVEDFELGVKNNLEVTNPIQSNGVFSGLPEELNGIHVYKLDEHIINILIRENRLLSENKFKHSYPHCWRTKTPLIYRATPQWFVSMNKNKLLEKTLNKLPDVNWLPSWGEARIQGMLSDRPDWCISRQRKWGVPITMLINKKTGEPHSNSSIIFSRVSKLVEEYGIEKWFDIDIKDLIDNPEDYEKVTDTLDVWFDSGSSHAAVLEKTTDLEFPADLYLEGSDQHRGWFQSSLLTSVAISDSVPYKTAMTHGFTVDAKGNKMSKSKGNVIAPQKIIDRFGSDILRLWVASTDCSSEMNVSEEILNRTSDKYRKIRNTIRFLLSNIADYNPEKFSQDCITIELDKWIIKKAMSTQNNIIDSYNSYNFHQLTQLIHSFCVNELGSFYLDVIKDRQYTCKKNSKERISGQHTMFYLAKILLTWIAPICPHTAEEAWQHIPEIKDESIFLGNWINLDINNFQKCNITDNNWNDILEVKKAVSKALEEKREKNIIGSSLDADITIYCSRDLFNTLSSLGKELKFIFITSNATLMDINDIATSSSSIAINEHNIIIDIINSKNKKCERCWHKCKTVGQDKKYINVCNRCISNVFGEGEIRINA
jgi:isoleucyl-tRNA synthetase